jgi:hypothetical protein
MVQEGQVADRSRERLAAGLATLAAEPGDEAAWMAKHGS